MRWDYVYDLLSKRQEILTHCTISSLNLSDKQDPSMAVELFTLYDYFFAEGYTAMGMFLKAGHFMMEAFLRKDIDPYRRVYLAWYAKSFFVYWDRYVAEGKHFLSDETFKDTMCCIDALILYILLLVREFQSAPVVPWLLGSDACEQLFAFIRTSMFLGRRTNIDSERCARGMEKRNKYSLNSGEEDTTAYAHTRNRTVLKPPAPLPGHPQKSYKHKNVKIYYGKDVIEYKVRNYMIKGTDDFKADCKKLKIFTALLEIPRGKKMSKHRLPDHDDEEDEFDSDQDLVNEEVDEEIEVSATHVATPLGNLHAKTAEAIYLNGGKTSVGNMKRVKRFHKLVFNMKSGFSGYDRNRTPCCSNAMRVGQTMDNMPPFKRGIIKFISRNQHPLHFFCKTHSEGKADFWLLVARTSKYERFQFP